MKLKRIGCFDFSKGNVDITDPGYHRDVWCRMNQVDIKPGTYDCYVYEGKYGSTEETYTAIAVIGLSHTDNCMDITEDDFKEIGAICVDAGLAGFFPDKPDYDDDAWYDFCQQIKTGNAWITDDGFFSSSGFGDGGYGVFAKKVNGDIVALEIRFIEGHEDFKLEKESEDKDGNI